MEQMPQSSITVYSTVDNDRVEKMDRFRVTSPSISAGHVGVTSRHVIRV